MLSYPQYPGSAVTLVATGGWQTLPISIVGQQYKQISAINNGAVQFWLSTDQVNEFPVPASSNVSGLMCNIGQGAALYARNDTPTSAAGSFTILLGP